MNWRDRVRREMGLASIGSPAKSADGNPTAVMAVRAATAASREASSNGSNGSASPRQWLDSEAAREALDEGAAIMEHGGCLCRDGAERKAWTLSVNQ